MILENAPPVHVHNPRKIKRKHGGVVVTELEMKQYKVVFYKRRLMDNFDSLPYGYLVIYLLLITLNSGVLRIKLHFIFRILSSIIHSR